LQRHDAEGVEQRFRWHGHLRGKLQHLEIVRTGTDVTAPTLGQILVEYTIQRTMSERVTCAGHVTRDLVQDHIINIACCARSTVAHTSFTRALFLLAPFMHGATVSVAISGAQLRAW
jgi:hypothetical protein